MGVHEGLIHVTADPVLRVRAPGPELGRNILAEEADPHQHVHAPDDGQRLLRQVLFPQAAGLSVQAGRHRLADAHRRYTAYVLSRADGIVVRDGKSRDLLLELGVPEGLIHVRCPRPRRGRRGSARSPRRTPPGARGCISPPPGESPCCGCMDVLVGVRLHSLIYAAVMGTPMIGISYDPKVESFLSSIRRPTPFTVEECRGPPQSGCRRPWPAGTPGRCPAAWQTLWEGGGGEAVRLAGYMRVMVLTLPVIVLTYLLVALFQSLEHFVLQGSMSIPYNLALIAFLAVFAQGLGVGGYVAAVALAWLLQLGMTVPWR